MVVVVDSSLHLNSVLQDLTLHPVTIEIEYPTIELLAIFEANASLPGVVLTAKRIPIGMISRRKFFERMSRPYSRDLFNQRPIQILYQFLAKDILLLPGTTPIQRAARLSLERPSNLLYEPIVVELAPNYHHVLGMQDLLQAHSQIHELTVLALQDSQQALRHEKELAQTTLDSIGDGVIATDALERIQTLNPVAERLTGWTLNEVKGMRLSQAFHIVHETTRERLMNPVALVLQERYPQAAAANAILIARDGSECSIDNSATPIYSKEGHLFGAVLVFRDVSQERNLARQLEWQASHDGLTQLVNRHQFEQCLQQAFNQVQVSNQAPISNQAQVSNQAHCLCCFDLDRFKVVNDTCGHMAGDELLRQISRLIQESVRYSDTVARLGGDEFAVLLYCCPLEKGIAIAQNIRQRLQDFRFIWQEHSFNIGASFGLTVINASTPSSAIALSEADAACYRAKRQGRNRVEVFQPEGDHPNANGGIPWVTQITRALEQDRFQLYCQAIVPVAQTVAPVIHYEVLLRMLDDANQLVLPSVFMPTAERYNLMPAIDRWVIQSVFQVLSVADRPFWQDAAHQHLTDQFVYAINLSGASLGDEGFVEFVKEQFTRYSIPPELICFEITETVAISNLSKATQFIQALKQLGCRFALDDFGSGMSSFGYLKTLPVDYLKIDGSFIKELVHDSVAIAMVEAIQRIGELMGLQTIAEYVENNAILAVVQQLGIHYAQGFGLAQPQPLT